MDRVLLRGPRYFRILVFSKRLPPFLRQGTMRNHTPLLRRGLCIIVFHYFGRARRSNKVLCSTNRRSRRGQSEIQNVHGIIVTVPAASIHSTWGCTHLGYGFCWANKTNNHALHTNTQRNLYPYHGANVFIHLAPIQPPISYALSNDIREVRSDFFILLNLDPDHRGLFSTG